MSYKNQIGENPDWEMKQLTWRQLRKAKTRQTHLLWLSFCTIFIFLGIKVYITHPNIFSCDKDKGICTLQTQKFYESLYKEKYTFKIDEITGARLRRGTMRVRPTIILKVNNTNIHLYDTYLYSIPESSLEEQTHQINNFLKSNKRKIEIKERIPNIRDGSIWIAVGLLLFIPYILPIKKKKKIHKIIVRKS